MTCPIHVRVQFLYRLVNLTENAIPIHVRTQYSKVVGSSQSGYVFLELSVTQVKTIILTVLNISVICGEFAPALGSFVKSIPACGCGSGIG